MVRNPPKDSPFDLLDIDPHDAPRSDEIHAAINQAITKRQKELCERVAMYEERERDAIRERKRIDDELAKMSSLLNESDAPEAQKIAHKVAEYRKATRKELGAVAQKQSAKMPKSGLFHKARAEVYMAVCGVLRERAEKWEKNKDLIRRNAEIISSQRAAQKQVNRWAEEIGDDSFLFSAGPYDVFMCDLKKMIGLD